ncbi:MAG: hypothetical protein NW223_19730 [Hyphomicrobiaceae bacterium]|nr:hypothetical protein [Hyphomicrobiaceae bacterium]
MHEEFATTDVMPAQAGIHARLQWIATLLDMRAAVRIEAGATGAQCPDREIRLILPHAPNEFRDLKDTRKIMKRV